MSRYSNRPTILNNNKLYQDLLKTRGKNYVVQYGLGRGFKLSLEQRKTLNPITHVWQHHDKLWKIASQYYSEPTLWWVIATYNEKPTDSHYSPGDIVYVPFPLSTILKYIGL